MEPNYRDSFFRRYSWLEAWKATATRRLDLIRQRVRELFDGKRRHVDTRPARDFEKRAVGLKLAKNGRRGVRGEYTYYLASPTLTDFTIWQAFYPHEDGYIPEKARVEKKSVEFSILCAFFPENLEEVCVPKSSEALPEFKIKEVNCFMPVKLYVPTRLSLVAVPRVEVPRLECQQLERKPSMVAVKALTYPVKRCSHKEFVEIGMRIFYTESQVDMFLRKLFSILIGIKRMMVFFQQTSNASADTMMVLRAARIPVLCRPNVVSSVQVEIYAVISFICKMLTAIKMLNSMSFTLWRASQRKAITSGSPRVTLLQAGSVDSFIMLKSTVSSGHIEVLLPSLPSVFMLRSDIYTPRSMGKYTTGFQLVFDSQDFSQMVSILNARSLTHNLQRSQMIANGIEVKQAKPLAQKCIHRSLKIHESVFQIGGLFVGLIANQIFTVTHATVYGGLMVIAEHTINTMVMMVNKIPSASMMAHLQIPSRKFATNENEYPLKEIQPLPTSSTEEAIIPLFQTSPKSMCEQTCATFKVDRSTVQTPETYATGNGSQKPSTENKRLIAASPIPLRRKRRTVADIGYSEETIDIFLQMEYQYKADPGYLEWQWGITQKIRDAVVSWMVLVTEYLNICEATFFLAIDLLNRFLSVCNVSEDLIQLLATTCIFIAGKFEEDMGQPNVHVLTRLCGGAYTFEEILDMERRILLKLDCHVFVPTAAWFCAEYLYICEGDEKLEHLTMFFAELTMMDLVFLNPKPSMIAAAALCLARYYLEARIWTFDLWKKCHYLPMDVLQIMKYIIVTYTTYRDTEDAARQSIHNKYSTEKYHEVAKLVNCPETEVARIEWKCAEFGEIMFARHSRSHISQFRGNRYFGEDIPFACNPDIKYFAVQNSWPSRESTKVYDNETYRIMLAAESKSLTNPSYILMQTAITEEMRQAEVNWLIRHLESTRYPSSTLILAVNMMDRFLSQRFVKREMFRLLTATCLMIAMKFETRYPFDINTIVGAVDQTYPKSHLIKMEGLVLSVLDFYIMVPTASWFCEELLKACDAEDTLKELTRYLMEMTTLETRYLEYRPSQIAAAAHSIARYSLGHFPWTKDLLERSGYKLEDFLECLNDLFEDYKMTSSRLGELQCKYGKLRHMVVADLNTFPVPNSVRFLGQYSKAMRQK